MWGNGKKAPGVLFFLFFLLRYFNSASMAYGAALWYIFWTMLQCDLIGSLDELLYGLSFFERESGRIPSLQHGVLRHWSRMKAGGFPGMHLCFMRMTGHREVWSRKDLTRDLKHVLRHLNVQELTCIRLRWKYKAGSTGNYTSGHLEGFEGRRDSARISALYYDRATKTTAALSICVPVPLGEWDPKSSRFRLCLSEPFSKVYNIILITLWAKPDRNTSLWTHKSKQDTIAFSKFE